RAHRHEAAERPGRHETGAGGGDRGSEEGRSRRRRLMGEAAALSRVVPPAAAARRLGALERRFQWWCLGPTLAVLAVVTLLPTLYLVATSLTPLSLTRPETAWDFSRPLRNYALLAADQRFLGSLWVQAKLSFWTVGAQLLLGLAFALLLNLNARFLEALRTVFLLPMVLPPIVVAIIWKVLYTP